MKKISAIVITMLILSVEMTAQNKYYYCDEKKIPLIEQTDKSVIITPKATAGAYNWANTLKTVRDNQLNIKVVDRNSVPSAMTKASPVRNGHLESCFRNMSGMELIPTGYINVELKKSTDYGMLQSLAMEYNLVIVGQNDFMPLWYSLRLGKDCSESVIDIANAIYETGSVSSCSPDFSFDGLEISYDPYVSKQWGLHNSDYKGIDISASKAWTYSTGMGIKIAIVDGGVDVLHQDLAENVYKSYDFTLKEPMATAHGDHATHCAGIAAAVRNNGIQIAGVAPDAKIMSAGIDFSDSTANVIRGLADGINWAWKNGADVISCSWGSPECGLIKRAIDSALYLGREGKGCVFVKSAGNKNKEITFPGAYRKEVIAVAALQKNGKRCEDSCFGDNMLVAAPGDTILSTIRNNKIGYDSGTSMACPHVAGVAALILARNPSLTALQVREILAKSTKQVGDKPYDITKEFGQWNQWYGYGMIDAYKAVMNTPRN